MPADEDPPPERRVLGKDRMEGFSDGVYGFAATLLTLDLYGLTLLAISLLGSALDAYARHEHLYSPAGEGEELHSTQRKSLPAVIGFVIAILIGLALPKVVVALYSGIAVYLVVPFREATRVLIGRHSTRQ